MITSNDAVKIILCGANNVGKTVLLNTITGESTDTKVSPTLSPYIRTISYKHESETIPMNIWDTAGEERYRSLTKIYFRGAHFALVLFDITNVCSFDRVPAWIDDIKENGGEFTQIILISNKNDLEEQREVQDKEIKSLAEEFGIQYISISAKSKPDANLILSELSKIWIQKKKWSGIQTVQNHRDMSEVDEMLALSNSKNNRIDLSGQDRRTSCC